MFTFEWADTDKDNENGMLELLYSNTCDACRKQNDRYEDNPDGEFEYDYITIIINKVAHRFLLGGPQMTGLERFIQNICEENGYEMPWRKVGK